MTVMPTGADKALAPRLSTARGKRVAAGGGEGRPVGVRCGRHGCNHRAVDEELHPRHAAVGIRCGRNQIDPGGRDEARPTSCTQRSAPVCSSRAYTPPCKVPIATIPAAVTGWPDNGSGASHAQAGVR